MHTLAFYDLVVIICLMSPKTCNVGPLFSEITFDCFFRDIGDYIYIYSNIVCGTCGDNYFYVDVKAEVLKY